MRVEPVFSAEAIRERVAALADRVYRDYVDSPLAVLLVAEGARRFAEDLLGELARRGLEPERRVVRARRSAGSDLEPLEIAHLDPDVFEDRDVLVVNDIADEGETLRSILELLALGEPRSVRTAVLLDKRERRREPVRLDYVGFQVESGWHVGYGMDLDGAYRELDWIGRIVDERF